MQRCSAGCKLILYYISTELSTALLHVRTDREDDHADLVRGWEREDQQARRCQRMEHISDTRIFTSKPPSPTHSP